jgi:endoglucanase
MFCPKALSLVVLSAIGMPFLHAEPNPVKLAAQTRFDLSSPSVPLEKAEVLQGNGRVQRPNWVAGAAQSRTYTANFAVVRFSWSEIALQFVPGTDGPVELKLMGPWEEASPGSIYRQEILWDAVEVSGAAIENGGFENVNNSLPLGWTPSGGTIQSGLAFEGRNSARTWHNQTLSTSFQVKAGVPVTIKMVARAYVPTDFPEMRRLAGKNTAAHKMAARFLKGANFGNYLEAPPGQDWGAKYAEADCLHMAQEGFDHVRLPIAWHYYAGAAPDYELSRDIYAKADFLVTNALKHRLNVIVNIHHFDAFTTDPVAQRRKFIALWRQIAAHYAKAPEGVAFELLNEPRDKATTVVLNPIYSEVIHEIRKSNPARAIFLGPGKWNSIDELGSLLLPDNDENLIVTVHCYDPFYFSHQGATWSGPDTKVTGIKFPGPPATPLVPDPSLKLKKGVLDWIEQYNTLPAEQNPSGPIAFRGRVKLAHDWSTYYGRPVHMGEFGAYIRADPESRANFYGAFRKDLDQNGIGWAVWDWKAGFKYWEDASNRPAPGMHEALFGK